MKNILICEEIGMSYEGVDVDENDDYGIMNPNGTKDENQVAFFKAETWTYKEAMYRKLDKIIQSGEYTDEENKEYRQYRNEITRADNHFECSSNMVNSYTEFSGPLIKVIEFEKTYYNIKPIHAKQSANDVIPKKKFEQCELCNKKFFDFAGRKLDIKYQLNHHRKSCRKQYKKKRRRMVVEFLKESADQEIIDKIFNEYKDILILDNDC